MSKKAAKNKALSAAQAEAHAKRAARQRRIIVRLTEDQLAALTVQWKKVKPTEACELIFEVNGEATSGLKVAGYSYHGDTCCA